MDKYYTKTWFAEQKLEISPDGAKIIFGSPSLNSTRMFAVSFDMTVFLRNWVNPVFHKYTIATTATVIWVHARREKKF